MKTIFLSVLAITLLVTCTKKTQKGELNSAIKLSVNQSAVIESEDLKVTLVDVNDSRCPEGAQCIWAGEAVAFLTVNNTAIQVSTMHTTDTLGYQFSYDLMPYPKLDKEVKLKDYVVKLNITK